MKKLFFGAMMMAFAAATFVSCGNSTPKADLKDEVDTLSYAMGMAQTQGLKEYLSDRLQIDTAYMDDFIKGLNDGANAGDDKKKAAYYAGIPNKVAGEKFLAANKKKPGVVTLPSGVQYKVIKEGNGPMPKDTSMVKVQYEGKTIDGNVFDSSYKRGEPVSLRANQVIKGWTEALVHMPVGSVWEVYIPQNLAYGEREQGQIKPFSVLIFKIELVSLGEK